MSQEILFQDVIDLLEQLEIRYASFKTVKRARLKYRELIFDWWSHICTKYTQESAICHLFPIFQILAPELDKRRKFGMLETSLSRSIQNIFGLKNTVRGRILEDWKGVNCEIITVDQGDLASRIAHILKTEYDSPISMTLTRLHFLLDELSFLCKWTTLPNPGIWPRATNDIIHDLYVGQSGISMKVEFALIIVAH